MWYFPSQNKDAEDVRDVPRAEAVQATPVPEAVLAQAPIFEESFFAEPPRPEPVPSEVHPEDGFSMGLAQPESLV